MKNILGVAITPMGWTSLVDIGRSIPRPICSANVFGIECPENSTDDNMDADTDDNANDNTDDDKDDNTDTDTDNGISRQLG